MLMLLLKLTWNYFFKVPRTAVSTENAFNFAMVCFSHDWPVRPPETRLPLALDLNVDILLIDWFPLKGFYGIMSMFKEFGQSLEPISRAFTSSATLSVNKRSRKTLCEMREQSRDASTEQWTVSRVRPCLSSLPPLSARPSYVGVGSLDLLNVTRRHHRGATGDSQRAQRQSTDS